MKLPRARLRSSLLARLWAFLRRRRLHRRVRPRHEREFPPAVVAALERMARRSGYTVDELLGGFYRLRDAIEHSDPSRVGPPPTGIPGPGRRSSR